MNARKRTVTPTRIHAVNKNIPIEAAVLNGLQQVRLLDAVAAREVGDGARGWRTKPEVRNQMAEVRRRKPEAG
jgi:hypothetical protein